MRKSAGILVYRKEKEQNQYFLVHPGGPFWKNKNEGAWSVPKGEFDDTEDALNAAKREFKEETGTEIHGNFIPLEPIKQKSGKMVYVWAVEGDVDCSKIRSNSFSLQWPPKSGKFIDVPEIDRGEWFDYEAARKMILAAQIALVDQVEKILQTKK